MRPIHLHFSFLDGGNNWFLLGLWSYSKVLDQNLFLAVVSVPGFWAVPACLSNTVAHPICFQASVMEIAILTFYVVCVMLTLC